MAKNGCRTSSCKSACGQTLKQVLAQKPEGPTESVGRAQECFRNALFEVHALGHASGNLQLLEAAEKASEALRILREMDEQVPTMRRSTARGAVVLLDANRCNNTFLERMLSAAGYGVVATAHTREALQAVGDPDVVGIVINAGTLPTFDHLRVSEAIPNLRVPIIVIDDEELGKQQGVSPLPRLYEAKELLLLLDPQEEQLSEDEPLGEDELVDPVVEVLAGRASLPGLAPIAGRVHQLLGRHNVGVDEVLEVISQDPVIVASILRSANSSRNSISREITSIEAACVRLGNQLVVSMAQEVALAGAMHFTAEPMHSLAKKMWKNFVATADLAMRIATQNNHPNPAAIRTAALLHNIGDLLLLHRASVFAPRWRARGIDLPSCMGEHSKAKHAQLGASLLKLWGLPQLFVSCAELHDSERSADPEVARALDIINLAHKLVVKSGLDYLPGQKAMATDLVGPLRRLRLAADALEENTAAVMRASR